MPEGGINGPETQICKEGSLLNWCGAALSGHNGTGSASIRKAAISYHLQLQEGTATAEMKKLCWRDDDKSRKQTGRNQSLYSLSSLASSL